MVREQIRELFADISATFPNYRQNDKTRAVNKWTEYLADFEADKIQAALKHYCLNDKSGFAPSPGQLVDHMRQIEAEEFRQNQTSMYDDGLWMIGKGDNPYEAG